MTDTPRIEAATPGIARTVWGVTSFDRGGNAGYVVHLLFTTEAEARRYVEEEDHDPTGWAAGSYEIEQFDLYESDTPRRPMTDTPRTEAGRRLVQVRDLHTPDCPRWSVVSEPDARCTCILPEMVLAIEAEAAPSRGPDLPRKALGEILAYMTYERSNPHGYGCQMCEVETTEPPYRIEHDAECEAEVVREWLTAAALDKTAPKP